MALLVKRPTMCEKLTVKPTVTQLHRLMILMDSFCPRNYLHERITVPIFSQSFHTL
jgi:hypothetical protein